MKDESEGMIKTLTMKITLLKISYIFLLFSFIATGCEKENVLSVSKADDPLTKLDWLKNMKNDMEKDAEVSSAEITLYQWNNANYIYVQKTIRAAYDFPNTIFDYEGNEKYKCGGNQLINTCSAFFSEAQEVKILWKKGS